QPNDVRNKRRIVLPIELGLEIGDVATDAGEVLLEVDQQTVSRVLVVVERVVVQRVAERRGDGAATRQLLADRQRSFAIEVAAKAVRGCKIDSQSRVGIHECRAWVEQRIRRAVRQGLNVVTVRQIRR